LGWVRIGARYRQFADKAFDDPAAWHGIAPDLAGEEYAVAIQGELLDRPIGGPMELRRFFFVGRPGGQRRSRTDPHDEVV
jgi:hypothetical protein